MRHDPQHPAEASPRRRFWCALTDHDYIDPPGAPEPFCRRCGCGTYWPVRKTLGRLLEDGLHWLARRLRHGDEIPFALAALANGMIHLMRLLPVFALLLALPAFPAIAAVPLFTDGFETGDSLAWDAACEQSDEPQPIPEIVIDPPEVGQTLTLTFCGLVILTSPEAICPFLYAAEADGVSPDFGEFYQTLASNTGEVILLGTQFGNRVYWVAWGDLHIDLTRPDYCNNEPATRERSR